jgi:formate dehydrogenase major subunit
MADLFMQLRPGTDIAWLGGVINYLLSNDKIHRDYVLNYTNASYLVKDEFGFQDGLFTGYNAEKRDYDRSSWDYVIGEDGFATVDPTLQNPRCVYQLMKQHYARYTPEMVERITGAPKDKFLKACEWIAETAAPDKAMTSMYALGWTQHSKGSQNIRTMAIIQLLLGNIGVAGGGMNALRGHSNIQGLTDLGLMSNLIPGYLTLPVEKEVDRTTYLSTRGFKPLRPGQISYWQNYPKFFTSFQKAMYGKAAMPENDFAYDWLPKLDVTYDVLRAFDLMFQGKMNGYFCQGFNPLMSFPNKKKIIAALSQLKFLVVMDPLATETAGFWENHGEYNDVDTASIQTEVFRLPTSCFAEETGSLTNSGRWLQWHWKGAEPPGEAKTDVEIMAKLYLKVKELYVGEGGVFRDPILNLVWPYAVSDDPTTDEIAKEVNGSALEDLPDPTDPLKPPILKAGQLVDGFAQLRDDGKTACGCWIYSGSYTEKGNQMARRDNADPTNSGLAPNWAWSWPANRRILYNRASCDTLGRPYNPKRKLIAWNGARWGGVDVPDMPVTSDPVAGAGPFIMNAEGVARLFTRNMMRDGPFPEHYEPFEAPVENVLHPKVGPNPVARVFKADMEVFGKPDDFPIVATTYRLTEHFHFWSKHVLINAILQPQQFIEMGEELAKEKGIANGDVVEVRSNRGRITAVAVVTKRIKALAIDGKTVHTVGIPIHWGFTGETRKGFAANVLTPYVGDANIETPEYKAFLVDVNKAAAAVS